MRQLPETSLQQLKANSKAGREAWKRGDIELAERYFSQAWASIPDAKMEFDYAQSLSRGFVIFFRGTKQFEKAHRWIGVMRKAYGPEPSEYVDFIAATVHYDAGDVDAAFALFDEQFKKYGRRPFEGEDEKYLRFYKERAAAK